jgi:hypothetical protein
VTELFGGSLSEVAPLMLGAGGSMVAVSADEPVVPVDSL